MENPVSPSSGWVSIAAVSRDTLRVWERRYGFPSPQRDAQGERVYPLEQVRKLRVLKRLLDTGHRPGRVVTLGIEALERLCDAAPGGAARTGAGDAAASPQGSSPDPVLQECLDALRAHQIPQLRRLLAQALLRLGLARFVTELVAPLTVCVGDAWMRGQLQVFEEHLFSESLQGLMRQAIAQVPEPAADEGPRVLLATLPGEAHGLGLLMVEALLALEGCRVLSLGVQTPLQDIVLAAAAHRADIVGLSFSASQNPVQVLEGLAGLRAALPPGTALWAGGSAPVLQRRPPADVTVVSALRQLPAALRPWRRAG